MSPFHGAVIRYRSKRAATLRWAMVPGSGHFFSRATARKGGRPQAWSTWPWVYTAAATGAGSTARTAAKVRSRAAKLPVSTRTSPASVRSAVTLAQMWKKISPGTSSSCLPVGRQRSRRGTSPRQKRSARSSTSPMWARTLAQAKSRRQWRGIDYAALSLLLLCLIISLFVRLPGAPTVLLVEPGAAKGDVEAMRARLGLDRSLIAQFGSFMADLARGDLGQSFYYRTPVFELYLSRLPNSLLLALVAMSFSLLIGIPSGILASVRVNTWWDNAGKLFALLGLSLPSFWTGLLLILFFSVYLGWLPSSGSGTPLHLLMPAFALGWYFAAAHMRLTRASMLEGLGSEYIKLARLKGLPEAFVVGKHALKHALVPVITLAGLKLVLMINVAVVVETVFAWPGVGRLFYEGIAFRDFPVVQTSIILSGTMIVAVNLAVDLLYAVIDPRIRYER